LRNNYSVSWNLNKLNKRFWCSRHLTKFRER
jgi:hypothetical protein